MGYYSTQAIAIAGHEPTVRDIGTDSNVSQRSGSIEDPNVSIAEALAELGSIGSDAGERVTPKRALSIPALYQAVSMISGDVAKLPMGTWRRLPTGGKTLDRDHHAFRFINLFGMANPEINTYKFWRRLMTSALLWNNGYAWIDKNGRGEVLGLYNLLPDRTTPIRIKGKLWFVTEVNGQLEPLPADEVFHIEGISLDGFQGENLVKLFRQHFGQCLAKRKFASKFFGQGMTAGGVLGVPPEAKPSTVKKLQAAIKQKFSNSSNAFKTLVLRDGFKWFNTQVDPQKAQLTEWSENDVREIARMYNLRASRLSVEGSTSYNSDEQAKADYHDGTLSHWLIGMRCEANAKFRTDDEIERDEVFVDYNVNALLWADAKTRNEIATTGIQHGRWSPNETRSWENLNPYEGGDTFYRPLNLESVQGQAARQLATDTITRAKNRLQIKRQRNKYNADERAAILEMITPACQVLARDPTETLATIESANDA